jgi:hypothetical protein
MTANRIAALAGTLAGLAALIAGLAQVLPGTWPNVALAAAGLLTKLATIVKFLDGSQRWDQLTAGDELEPGDPDTIPHIAVTRPDSVEPDQGDAKAPTAPPDAQAAAA